MGRWYFPNLVLYGDDNAINEWTRRWDRLCGLDGKSPAEKAMEVFQKGIEAAEAELGLPDIQDPVRMRAKQARANKNKLVDLTAISQDMTEDEFVQWCADNGEDAGLVLRYELDLSRYQLWLDHLLSDGGEWNVSIIKRQAEEAGFTDADWNKIKCYASRQGYSKAYGVWRKR